VTELLLAPVELVSWRWLLQIVLLSLGLTLACRLAFKGDSQSLRSLGVAAVWLLAVVPVVLLVWQPRYQIGVINPPALPELAGVPKLLLLFWLLAAIYACASLLVAVVQTARQLSRLAVFVDSGCTSASRAFCERLDIELPKFVVGKRCCASSIGPATLVVPADFSSWPVTAKNSVLAHELVHLKRRDDRFMVALQFCARCYLFCPWLRVLYTRFVVALEEACDERAAELVGSRSRYLEGLAEAALREGGKGYDRIGVMPQAKQQHTTAPVAALINAHHKHSFMQRLARLLGQQRFFEVQSGALTAGVAIGLGTLAVLTTFEVVPVHKRYAATTISVPSIARDTGFVASSEHPSVTTVTNFSLQARRNEERYSPTVIYPGQALIDDIEGNVLVEYHIAADGSTVRPRVIESTHPTYLNRAAVRAVEQTVYYTDYSPGISGVTTARKALKTGALLAVRGDRSNKAQKLFLFRLNAAN